MLVAVVVVIVVGLVGTFLGIYIVSLRKRISEQIIVLCVCYNQNCSLFGYVALN